MGERTGPLAPGARRVCSSARGMPRGPPFPADTPLDLTLGRPLRFMLGHPHSAAVVPSQLRSRPRPWETASPPVACPVVRPGDRGFADVGTQRRVDIRRTSDPHTCLISQAQPGRGGVGIQEAPAPGSWLPSPWSRVALIVVGDETASSAPPSPCHTPMREAGRGPGGMGRALAMEPGQPRPVSHMSTPATCLRDPLWSLESCGQGSWESGPPLLEGLSGLRLGVAGAS